MFGVGEEKRTAFDRLRKLGANSTNTLCAMSNYLRLVRSRKNKLANPENTDDAVKQSPITLSVIWLIEVKPAGGRGDRDGRLRDTTINFDAEYSPGISSVA